MIVYVTMYVTMYVCMYVCMYVYIYIYTNTYIHVYVYTSIDRSHTEFYSKQSGFLVQVRFGIYRGLRVSGCVPDRGLRVEKGPGSRIQNLGNLGLRRLRV